LSAISREYVSKCDFAAINPCGRKIIMMISRTPKIQYFQSAMAVNRSGM